jgi:hypothetical protein
MASVRAVPAANGSMQRARPRELEDWLNLYLYHPLARRLAQALRPTGITPNMVSVAGMLLVWAASAAYVGLAWPAGAALGFILHLLWHVVDGADGHLARLRGSASATGELIDGLCDYGGHAVLYFALAAMLDGQIGGWAWPLATAAAASHAVQTNHAETQRRTYLWWGYGVPWLNQAQASGDKVFGGMDWVSRTFGWMARDYLRVAAAMSPNAARVDAQIDEAAGDEKRLALARRLARRAGRRSVLLQKSVGPNPRTLILGASMAFGSPLYFFLAELLLLNLLMIVSIRHHNRTASMLAERLSRSRDG